MNEADVTCSSLPGHGVFRRRSLKTRVTLFTLAIFVISIWLLAFYASKMLRKDMERLLGRTAVVDRDAYGGQGRR
jgi:membrane protein implicated in regulation of membrane protease activity